MSNSDGFIEEVTEELRRDQLFAAMKRYGWIVALLVVLIVGGAAYNEYRKSQLVAKAQDFGDQLLAALGDNDATKQAETLAAINTDTPRARALRDLLVAASQAEAEDFTAARKTLDGVANSDVPEMYRQIARFKAAILPDDALSIDERRQRFADLAQPGSAIRLMAQEQLALIEIETGNKDAAIAAFQSILSDAEVTPDLQERAVQVIVALGAEPELTATTETEPEAGQGE